MSLSAQYAMFGKADLEAGRRFSDATKALEIIQKLFPKKDKKTFDVLIQKARQLETAYASPYIVDAVALESQKCILCGSQKRRKK